MCQRSCTLGAAKGDFVLEARVTKINKRELLTLDNPNYGKLIEEHQHLRGIVMSVLCLCYRYVVVSYISSWEPTNTRRFVLLTNRALVD